MMDALKGAVSLITFEVYVHLPDSRADSFTRDLDVNVCSLAGEHVCSRNRGCNSH